MSLFCNQLRGSLWSNAIGTKVFLAKTLSLGNVNQFIHSLQRLLNLGHLRRGCKIRRQRSCEPGDNKCYPHPHPKFQSPLGWHYIFCRESTTRMTLHLKVRESLYRGVRSKVHPPKTNSSHLPGHPKSKTHLPTPSGAMVVNSTSPPGGSWIPVFFLGKWQQKNMAHIICPEKVGKLANPPRAEH